MSIFQLNLQGKDKVKIAIDRLKTMEPDEGYYLAFSGGKDSCVLKALAIMAKVKFDAHYSISSVDPPELIQFIKQYHKDVKFESKKDKNGKTITMWSLIEKSKVLPTRLIRFCCADLKETHGNNRFLLTGVRWNESVRRKKTRHLLEKKAKTLQDRKIYDNLEDARMFKFCQMKGSKVLNPIIDWTTEEVWEFIHHYNVPYCKLYDMGYKRLGCIGCPMGSTNARLDEFEQYPKYFKLYYLAVQKLKQNGGLYVRDTVEDCMRWWITFYDKSKQKRHNEKRLEKLIHECREELKREGQLDFEFSELEE